MPQEVRVYAAIWQPVQRLMKSKTKAENMILNMIVPIHNTHKQQDACRDAGVLLFILMSQLSLEDICLSFCRDTALEILALRQQGGGFLPCLTTKILRIYSSRFNWYINING